MAESPIQLTQMTLATTHTPKMVKFYDTLFGTQLQANEVYVWHNAVSRGTGGDSIGHLSQ